LRAGPAREEARRLLAEAVAVAQAEGVPLPIDTALADLKRVVEATAENRSSMPQDVERGRPTELDAISAEILRRGRSHGVAVPATAAAVGAAVLHQVPTAAETGGVAMVVAGVALHKAPRVQ